MRCSGVRARRGADRQHLGLSVGQARLWGDAVRDRTERRLHVAELRRSAALRGLRYARTRSHRGRQGARRQAGRLQGVRSGGVRAGRERAGRARAIASLADYTSHTAKTHSGIWRDLAVRKRKTEVDQQIGIIGTLGREAGIATPAIDRLVGADSRYRGRPPSAVVCDVPGTDRHMHIRHDGRVALVTGAAQGIGQAIARGLRTAARACTSPTSTRPACTHSRRHGIDRARARCVGPPGRRRSGDARSSRAKGGSISW